MQLRSAVKLRCPRLLALLKANERVGKNVRSGQQKDLMCHLCLFHPLSTSACSQGGFCATSVCAGPASCPKMLQSNSTHSQQCGLLPGAMVKHSVCHSKIEARSEMHQHSTANKATANETTAYNTNTPCSTDLKSWVCVGLVATTLLLLFFFLRHFLFGQSEAFYQNQV